MDKNPIFFEPDEEPAKLARNLLEWEESVIDSLSDVEGFAGGGQRVLASKSLRVILGLIFLILAARLLYLQGIKGEYYRLFAESNRLRKQVILAPRGLIKDRQGQVLAKNVASLNLVFVPVDLPKDNWREQLNNLSKIVWFDVATAEGKLQNVDPASPEPVLIKQNISLEESIRFETRASEFVGFSIQYIPVREYLTPEAFFHVIGYAALVTSEDRRLLNQELYSSFDFVGKAGIEQMYESYLHGTNGFSQLEVDAKGRVLAELGVQESKSGKTLVLNLDKELQELLYRQLRGTTGTRRAAAVALNPKTGEVLALLSLPAVDGAKFMRGISAEEYQKILNNPGLPLFNRAVTGIYPPGSTIKPLVAVAALQEGVVDANTVYADKGALVIPHRYDPTKDFVFYGWKRDGLGLVDIKEAIAKSSDIFFYIAAGGYPKQSLPGLGIEKLAEYLRKFNLGKITGIDLPGEKSGLVPDPAWKRQYYSNNAILSQWYLGDTYHVGIGQGDLLVTPLQVAFWTGLLANDGVGMQPQVLKRVESADSGEILFTQRPQVLVDRFADLKHIKLVQEGMRETVISGSARLLNRLSISAAGKTGTSQFDDSDPKKTHAWFTAYAPYDDPQIVITVLVEAAGEGSAVAVPVVYEALQWWAENRYNR